MPAFLVRTSLFVLLLGSVKCSIAQKSIVINDSLAANAEKLPVKTGNAWPWKVSNYSFGDYSIASSKAGWGTGTSKINLLGTKSQSKSSQKFSFVLTDKNADSAEVNAASNIMVRELRQTGLFPVFFVGKDELLDESDNFTAFITPNGDNSGCPASAKEVEYFIKILKKTSNLNEEELKLIAKRFRMNEQPKNTVGL